MSPDKNTPLDETGRRPAVEQADVGATGWRAAVHHQRVADPDHADFHAIAGELVATTAALASMVNLLAQQVRRYGDGRVLYDDTRTVDPRERLIDAGLELDHLGHLLHEAEDSANSFWSEISHVGVEVDQ